MIVIHLENAWINDFLLLTNAHYITTAPKGIHETIRTPLFSTNVDLSGEAPLAHKEGIAALRWDTSWSPPSVKTTKTKKY